MTRKRTADALLEEVRRALARSGSGFTELQRRGVAALCLIDGCSVEQAESAFAEAELQQLSRGSRLWHTDDDTELEYAVNRALQVRWHYRQAAPKLRLVPGGGAAEAERR